MEEPFSQCKHFITRRGRLYSREPTEWIAAFLRRAVGNEGKKKKKRKKKKKKKKKKKPPFSFESKQTVYLYYSNNYNLEVPTENPSFHIHDTHQVGLSSSKLRNQLPCLLHWKQPLLTLNHLTRHTVGKSRVQRLGLTHGQRRCCCSPCH